MSAFTFLGNFIRTNIKRLWHYIPHILFSVCLLFFIIGAAGLYLSNNLYKEQAFQAVHIGYYLPNDDDRDWNELGIGMLQEFEGMQDTVDLIQTDSIDEGYSMLKKGEILYFIIVPEQFFSGIMDSTNLPLEIIVNDTSSLGAYITNELFMSYASLLGIAQAGIYSALDTTRAHEYSSDEVHQISNTTNLTFLDRVLNKANYMESVDVIHSDSFSIVQQYIALTILLTLCFTAFILIPYLQGIGNGVREYMKLYHLNNIHVLISNTIATSIALFISFVPCFAAISIYTGTLHLLSLVKIMPVLLLLALFIACIATFSGNAFSANMFLLFSVLLFAYCGGGLLPEAMLPNAINNLSTFLPGKYVLQMTCHALFF